MPATLDHAPPTVSEAILKVSTLATLPEVTARIVAAVEDPGSSAARLHRIISHDPALVSRILKVVNSAFYGLPGQIGSIERAIVLLGQNAVKNIAVAASLGQLFRGGKVGSQFTARDLWTHCIAVGVTARELARRLRVPLVDEAFLAGMIHDLGLLVLLQAFPAELNEVCESSSASGRPFVEVERELIGTDHQQLGAALAEHWKFPRSCQLVAGYHHDLASFADDNRLLVRLVYVADTLCCEAGQGFNLTALGQSIGVSELGEGLIDPHTVDSLRESLPQVVSEAATIFR